MTDKEIEMVDELSLASEFPAASEEAWLELVDKVLKGASFEKKLVSETYDGYKIQPLYTRDNADVPAGNLPGQGDLRRGFSASGKSAGGWDIRQVHRTPDPADANRAILKDLERGVASVVVRLDEAARKGGTAADESLWGRDGVIIDDLAGLRTCLDGVMVDLAPVGLDAGTSFAPAAAALIAHWQSSAPGAKKALGSLNADPLAALARAGALPFSAEDALRFAADLAVYAHENLPNVPAITVDARVFNDAGASEAQELAGAMASGVAYLRAISEAGLDVQAAFDQIGFTFAADTDFFMTIAKLRAARILWGRIREASGVETSRTAVNVQTADRVMSKRDPWVNMLRTTIAAFAAGIGGADSVTVLPFDWAIGDSDGLAMRIARNTQLILEEESNLHRVIDPAGGSWFIESVTAALAEKAWAAFQEIEAEGGIVAAMKAGSLQQRIDTTWQARRKNLARRKDPLTGVSEFPNLREEAVVRPEPDAAKAKQARRKKVAAKHDDAARKVAEAKAEAGDGRLTKAMVDAVAEGATIGELMAALASSPATVTPLASVRFAGDIEALRDAADAYKAKNGNWPRIFLANIGPIAAFTARATFAVNFFEAGGIEALSNDGFGDAALAAAAYAESGADIAIICSSDEIYGEKAASVAEALKAKGANAVYLAGHPGDREESLRAAGVDEFVYTGCDLLGTLTRAHEILGV